MDTAGNGATPKANGQERIASGLCPATTAAGTPCRSPVLKGGTFCWMHSPSTASERRAAASKGGSVTAARRQLLLGNVDFSTPATVVSFIEALTRACLLNQVSAGVAETCSRLASEAARLRSAVDLAERVTALEATIQALEGEGGAECG